MLCHSVSPSVCQIYDKQSMDFVKLLSENLLSNELTYFLTSFEKNIYCGPSFGKEERLHFESETCSDESVKKMVYHFNPVVAQK